MPTYGSGVAAADAAGCGDGVAALSWHVDERSGAPLLIANLVIRATFATSVGERHMASERASMRQQPRRPVPRRDERAGSAPSSLGLRIGVGVVADRQQGARVDDEHVSVAAEAVCEQVVGVARVTSGGRCAEPDERELPLLARRLGRERLGQFGDHDVDADAAPFSLGP